MDFPTLKDGHRWAIAPTDGKTRNSYLRVLIVTDAAGAEGRYTPRVGSAFEYVTAHEIQGFHPGGDKYLVLSSYPVRGRRPSTLTIQTAVYDTYMEYSGNWLMDEDEKYRKALLGFQS